MKADSFEVSGTNVVSSFRAPETMSEMAADKWLTAARRHGVELLTYAEVYKAEGGGVYAVAWCVGVDEITYVVRLHIEDNKIAATAHGPAVRKEEG